MKRSHASELESHTALSMSLERQSAAEARAAFGILLMTVQLFRSSANRSERGVVVVGAVTGVILPGVHLDSLRVV